MDKYRILEKKFADGSSEFFIQRKVFLFWEYISDGTVLSSKPAAEASLARHRAWDKSIKVIGKVTHDG